MIEHVHDHIIAELNQNCVKKFQSKTLSEKECAQLVEMIVKIKFSQLKGLSTAAPLSARYLNDLGKSPLSKEQIFDRVSKEFRSSGADQTSRRAGRP